MNRAFPKFQVYQGAHVDPESRKSYTDGDMENWLNTELEAAAAADGASTYTVNAPPYDWELLRAPRMRPIPLTEEEDDDDLPYSGSGLGGWLNGTFDGASKTMTLSCLDFALPVPFSMDF
jgi:hypothetical protein